MSLDVWRTLVRLDGAYLSLDVWRTLIRFDGAYLSLDVWRTLIRLDGAYLSLDVWRTLVRLDGAYLRGWRSRQTWRLTYTGWRSSKTTGTFTFHTIYVWRTVNLIACQLTWKKIYRCCTVRMLFEITHLLVRSKYVVERVATRVGTMNNITN